MWIRSQDKLKLIDANYIRVNGIDIEAINIGTYAIIGTYSSQEKALEVLDIIEDCIVGNINCVFQMPQDEEKLDK